MHALLNRALTGCLKYLIADTYFRQLPCKQGLVTKLQKDRMGKIKPVNSPNCSM